MKKKLYTGILGGMVLFLLVATLAISYLLNRDTSSSPVAVRKSKAASITYKKILTVADDPTPIVPSVTPTTSFTPTPTSSLLASSTTGEGVNQPGTGSALLSPTETLLAVNNPLTPSPSSTTTTTLTPTKAGVSNLPASGITQFSTVLFMGAAAFIVFSFLY